MVHKNIQLKYLFEKYERYASPMVFLAGFIIDNFTLTRIDLWFSNLILFSYLFIAGASIVLVHFIGGRQEERGFPGGILPFLPFAMQFAFGALFSGYFVYYTRSGAFAGSWPFFAALVFLLVGNEFFKKKYERVVFQTSIFFTAVFSFAIFYLPVILHSMGAAVFVLSGIASLAVIALFISLLSRIAPAKTRGSKAVLLKSVFAIYVALNALYFTDSIPPVPLSLKNAGIYHFVARTGGGNYIATGEARKWQDYFPWSETVFHRRENEPVYFFSAVFAPTKFNTPIFHEWQFYDEFKKEWITGDTIRFSIFGGRDGGYRGYSMKTGVWEGRWRVNVITDRGALLGRETFSIADTVVHSTLETKAL